MSFLLDTNVISELVRVKPKSSVVNWFNTKNNAALYISVLTLGEIRKGVYGIPDVTRRNKINQWLGEELPAYFGERILHIDHGVADQWGRLCHQMKGHNLPAIDGLIAATALSHRLTLVTRNVKDFISTPVELINPWEL